MSNPILNEGQVKRKSETKSDGVRAKYTRYPFPFMEVYDYFEVDNSRQSSVKSAAYSWAKRSGEGVQFVTRVVHKKTNSEPAAIRVIRVA